MSVKVAINGFGRIGRLAFRQMFGAEGYDVVAINDLTSAKMLAHLLKYDSTQGNYVAQGHTVDFHEGEGEDNYIVVDGKKIVIYKMPNAADLPWGKLGVDVVLECTGFYTSNTNPYIMAYTRSNDFSGDGHGIESYFDKLYCSSYFLCFTI